MVAMGEVVERVVKVGLEGEAMVGEEEEEGTLGVTEEMAPFGEEDLEED